MVIQWADVERLFQHNEGWFCDLTLQGTSGDGDWQRLLDVVRARSWDFRYSENGADRSLPDIASIRSAQQLRRPLLTLRPPGCPAMDVHFFDDAQVEATFDPQQVREQAHLDGLLAFLRHLGQHFACNVSVTVESQPEMVLVEYDLTRDETLRTTTHRWS